MAEATGLAAIASKLPGSFGSIGIAMQPAPAGSTDPLRLGADAFTVGRSAAPHAPSAKHDTTATAAVTGLPVRT